MPSATVSCRPPTPSLWRGELEQDLARLGAGEAQRRAALLDRLAARGLPSFGVRAGVAGDHVDARERHVELFGRDLRERGEDALPELDLAGEHRDRAVGVDAEPGIEHAVAVEAAGQPRRLLRERRAAIEVKASDDAAERRLGEIAAGEGDVHVRSSPSRLAAPHDRADDAVVRAAAAEIARRAPSRTSASLGCGLRVEQRLGAHDHAVDAVAALRRLLVDEGASAAGAASRACRDPRAW